MNILKMEKKKIFEIFYLNKKIIRTLFHLTFSELMNSRNIL